MAIVKQVVEITKSQLIISTRTSEPKKKWPVKIRVINVQVHNAENEQNKNA